MLEDSYRFEVDEISDSYNMTLPIDPAWSRSKRRLLIVYQTIDGRDLKTKQLGGDKITRNTILNSYKYARKSGVPYTDGEGLPSFSVACANFNARRHLHLKKQARRDAEAQFAQRIQKLVKKLKPTHMLVSGTEAFEALYPDVEDARYKNGWVFDMSYKADGERHSLKVVPTLDLFKMLDRSSEHANLIGFYCRHLMNLMLGRNPHDLSKLEVIPKYVDSIEMFDKVCVMFRKAKEIAVDTETKNLSVLHNKLLTIQFAFDHTPNKGYIISVDHPLADWSKDERKYIKKRLKELFSETVVQDQTLLTFNGMFDLRIIRRALKIPMIWYRVWEITAGEHLLDENIGLLSGFMKGKHGGLAPILCSYGNDTYFTSEFKKEDRATIIAIRPNKKSVMKYMATDVVSLLAMKKQQIKRASMMQLEERNYKKYFIRHMMYQMSDTAHQLSHLREDGSLVSMKYLKFLMGQESPLKAELSKALNEMRQQPEVIEANKRLIGDSGLKAKSLLAFAKVKKDVSNWVFKWSKPDHKRTLFFDVMGLEPLDHTKTGEPQADKAFVKAYKDKNKVLQSYSTYQETEKLLSTYVRGWFKKLTRNADSVTDSHLRPDYSFWDVVTGRLASRNPSLQTIPQRSKIAKYIKRMFETTKGRLFVRYDYSAHEVRIWSVISGDKVLAGAFKAGQKLRKQLIKCLTKEERDAVFKELKTKGDIHIQNVFRFFGKWVEKSDPLRDAIKAVVFGVLYGKGAETLGIDTKQADMNAFKSSISTLYNELLAAEKGEGERDIKTIRKELNAADKKLAELLAEDRTDYAQGIIDKMMTEFKAGAKWTRDMSELAEKEYYVYSPIGRRRFLPAAMTTDRAIVSQQVRRGTNGPVQGLASEIGIKASRVFMELYYKHAPKIAAMQGQSRTLWELKVLYNRVVHDANYLSVIYSMMLPVIHMLQWAATYEVTKRYKDEFGLEFTVEPEIELETAAVDSQSYKWDWTIPNLLSNLKQTVKDADELGLLEGTQEEVMDEILESWRNPKIRNYLQKHFPLLGVTDLDEQIQTALDEFDASEKAERKAAKKAAKEAIDKAKSKKEKA
ncbi:hypothetical protein [Burkholderia phage BCSR5]|nr:hypothetical protein [Burkholderia phage BCSR5]